MRQRRWSRAPRYNLPRTLRCRRTPHRRGSRAAGVPRCARAQRSDRPPQAPCMRASPPRAPAQRLPATRCTPAGPHARITASAKSSVASTLTPPRMPDETSTPRQLRPRMAHAATPPASAKGASPPAQVGPATSTTPAPRPAAAISPAYPSATTCPRSISATITATPPSRRHPAKREMTPTLASGILQETCGIPQGAMTRRPTTLVPPRPTPRRRIHPRW